jgi:Na+/proline symporter
MKLLILFIILLLWQVPYIRQHLQKITVLESGIDALERLLSRVTWFSTDLGLLTTVFIIGIIFSLIDSLVGARLNGIYQGVLLLLVVASIQQMFFSRMMPEIQPEVMDSALFDQLPDTLWRINYCWVAPLFWYLLFGVFGVTFYWALAYFQQRSDLASFCADSF